MEYSTLAMDQEMDDHGVVYDLGSLFDWFSQIPDPRKERGKRYSLPTLLVLIFLAKMGTADTPFAIADWAKARQEELVSLLQLSYPKLPHHSTYRRVFETILDEEEFERYARDYQASLPGAAENRVLAFDGKQLRAAIPCGETEGIELVAVYAPESGQVIAQGQLADPLGGEIPAAEQVLAAVDLHDKVVLGDALHTQRALSRQVVEAGGDYVWTVKGNQGNTQAAIELLFSTPPRGSLELDFQTACKINKGHGRIEKRQLTCSGLLKEALDWPFVDQVFRLERTFHFRRNGQLVREIQQVHYGMTSLGRDQANAQRLLALKRMYWQIENGLHYRRDVTFHEDATQMSHLQAARNLATVHNLILSLFARLGIHNAAQARRYLDAHPEVAFSLLTSAHPRL
ncbi:MAG TPA: ISAs1 family transposase [Anaerolineaceae bacterium]|nr:ISAs1 family transposase [Anaerolineaceae bacterium]